MAKSAQTIERMTAALPPIGLTRDAQHTYTAHYPPAAPVTYRSVTGVLSVIHKEALLGWYAKIAAGWVVDNPQVVLQMLSELGREATVKAVAARGKAERDRKGAIGTRAHQAVESYLLGQAPVLDDETTPLFEQYLRFEHDWRFTPEWSEGMVVSERYGYAGTFDLIGKLKGKRALIDVKTGSFLAPEMGLQLAAYGAADYIGKPLTTDRWRIPRLELYLILQLQPTFYKLVPYAVGPAELQAFIHAQALNDWQRLGRKIIGQSLTEGMLTIA